MPINACNKLSNSPRRGTHKTMNMEPGDTAIQQNQIVASNENKSWPKKKTKSIKAVAFASRQTSSLSNVPRSWHWFTTTPTQTVATMMSISEATPLSRYWQRTTTLQVCDRVMKINSEQLAAARDNLVRLTCCPRHVRRHTRPEWRIVFHNWEKQRWT